MSCLTCGDKGMIRVPWTDAEDDFAVCLCDVGLAWRDDNQGYAWWQVWAAKKQIQPSRIFLLEEVLTPDELAERGFQPPATPTIEDREAALLAAGKTRRTKD